MKNDLQSQQEQRAWEEHNLSQLRYFRSLSLREKLEAVQGMADVVRRLQAMRAQGELKTASDMSESSESTLTSSAREPGARSR